jgi:uncharacterized cupredoxin-like copper-binding protein
MKRRVSICAGVLLVAALDASAHEAAMHHAGTVKKEQTEWGIAGEPKAVRRTIELTMSDDMRFTPDRIAVSQGETVKFVIRNKGRMLHELVIGTKKTLDEHADLMARFPNMEHAEAYMSHVKAGNSGEIVWKFNRPGEFDFACLITGHYQAGMVGKINVAPSDQAGKKKD